MSRGIPGEKLIVTRRPPDRDFRHMRGARLRSTLVAMVLSRALRVLGFALLAIAGLAELLGAGSFDATLAIWAVSYAVFGAGLALATPQGARHRRLAALSVQTPAMLMMAALAPCHFSALLTVIVAWQVAFLFSPRVTATWIAAQTLAVGYFLVPSCQISEGLASMISLLGSQVFAAGTVLIARRELEARKALVRANAELRATRALLAESCRAEERTRIARELHDVLGHDLTALGLQLEVAKNLLPEGKGHDHVARAQEVTSRLLHDVRDVVTQMKKIEGADLARALHALVSHVPDVAVHLDVQEPVALDDAVRAQCVLRCVQEIVTNTLKHAGARNLWICVRPTGDGIALEARDDGVRAPSSVRPGNGLAGMRDRVAELGGVLKVESDPARAFVVSAWLPIAGGAS